MAVRVVIAESPPNAFCPVIISYSSAPKEKMSLRASTLCPCACFGRHVADGAEDRSFDRHRHRADRLRFLGQHVRRGDLGQAEVENLDAARLGDHDVARLQVAMDDAGGVRRGQRVGNLHGVLQGLGNAEAARLESGRRASCPEMNSITM